MAICWYAKTRQVILWQDFLRCGIWKPYQWPFFFFFLNQSLYHFKIDFQERGKEIKVRTPAGDLTHSQGIFPGLNRSYDLPLHGTVVNQLSHNWPGHQWTFLTLLYWDHGLVFLHYDSIASMYCFLCSCILWVSKWVFSVLASLLPMVKSIN